MTSKAKPAVDNKPLFDYLWGVLLAKQRELEQKDDPSSRLQLRVLTTTSVRLRDAPDPQNFLRTLIWRVILSKREAYANTYYALLDPYLKTVRGDTPPECVRLVIRLLVETCEHHLQDALKNMARDSEDYALATGRCDEFISWVARAVPGAGTRSQAALARICRAAFEAPLPKTAQALSNWPANEKLMRAEARRLSRSERVNEIGLAIAAELLMRAGEAKAAPKAPASERRSLGL